MTERYTWNRIESREVFRKRMGLVAKGLYCLGALFLFTVASK